MIEGRHLWPASMSEGMYEDSDGRWTFHLPSRRLVDLFHLRVEVSPHSPALTMEDSAPVTYGDLDERICLFARELGDRGIHPGSRVGLLLDNSIEFIVAYYAINSLDATVCPLPGKLTDEELARLIVRSHNDALILERSRVDGVDKAMSAGGFSLPPIVSCERDAGAVRWRFPEQPIPAHPQLQDAPAIVMFTSGTTSESKGVRLSNRAVLHAVESYRRTLGITREDSCLIAVPMYHITGMVAIIGLMLSVGGHLVIHRRLEARHFLTAVNRHQISFIHASPTVFALLLPQRTHYPELHSVRMLASGAAHTPVRMIEELHEWMPCMEFRTIYGMTETTSPATVMPEDAATSLHKGASGWVIPGLEMRICDELGREVPAGECGEICFRGPNITDGYEGRSQTLTADHWLHTGDVGWLSEDGFLYVVDRIKDMVNRGGEKVWCVDVEEALRHHEFVADAAVVGVPDSVYGEVPAAVVILHKDPRAVGGEGEALQRIREEVALHLSKHEMPVYLEPVSSIPHTPGMKVDKVAIRKMLTGRGRQDYKNLEQLSPWAPPS